MSYPAEIIPQKLYFLCTEQQSSGPPPGVPPRSLCYWLDNDLIYEPFCADFGPCNMSHTWRFCQRVNHLLQQAESRGQVAYLLVGPHPHKRANAAVLVGLHSVIYLNKRAEEAYAPLRPLEPFVGFRDASCGVPTYTLSVADVIRGIARAREVGFINWHKGEKFDVDEYDHYEQVENGDLNWIVPGKFVAFAGPSAQPKHFGGWRTFTPEDYIPYFRERGVTSVVRLNKKMYEPSRFTAHGVTHHDLYFPDGTCPSEPILYNFLDITEREPGALAVHCKAGLGRTGVLICSYMIKHYGFTAEEAMGYIRICRPGSVIGPQQHYLIQYAPRLLHEGRAMRHPAADPLADTLIRMKAQQQRQQQQQPTISPASMAAPSAGSTGKKVIEIVATSRTVDITSQQAQPPPRRSTRLTSPKLSGTAQFPPAGGRSAGSATYGLHTDFGAMSVTSAAKALHSEPNHIVSVPDRHLPPATSNKSANSLGAPVHIYVEAQDQQSQQGLGNATPPRQATRAPIPSLANSPSGPSQGSMNGASTPPASKASLLPPSSTKRVLAPNGQPRKIPMAMSFDQASAVSALEDRDMVDAGPLALGEESWTVGSQPAQDDTYSSNSSRVGALAAAAGRGATAFVEAFRSAVGAHRTSYNDSRR